MVKHESRFGEKILLWQMKSELKVLMYKFPRFAGEDVLVYLRSSVTAFPALDAPLNASRSLKVAIECGGSILAASSASFSRIW